jgi:hypothetical protein
MTATEGLMTVSTTKGSGAMATILRVGYIAGPDDLSADELDWLQCLEDEGDGNADDDEDWDEYVEIVERAPRRSTSGAPARDHVAGPRTRMASLALGAGVFAEEPGGFTYSGSRERGPTARPLELSRVARARVIELLEDAAGGLPLVRMRALMRPGRRTKAASEDYERLTAAIASLRARRRIRVDHLAELLGCDPATVWRLTIRGRSQLQDCADRLVGSSAQQLAA